MKNLLSHQNNISSKQLSSEFISKMLFSRNFCQKCVRVNFFNFHTVLYLDMTFQERFEASHKMIRKYRAGRSRRHDKKSKIDILHWLMLDSDPRIRRYRKKEKKSKKSAPATATNEDELLVQSMFE